VDNAPCATPHTRRQLTVGRYLDAHLDEQGDLVQFIKFHTSCSQPPTMATSSQSGAGGLFTGVVAQLSVQTWTARAYGQPFVCQLPSRPGVGWADPGPVRKPISWTFRPSDVRRQSGWLTRLGWRGGGEGEAQAGQSTGLRAARAGRSPCAAPACRRPAHVIARHVRRTCAHCRALVLQSWIAEVRVSFLPGIGQLALEQFRPGESRPSPPG